MSRTRVPHVPLTTEQRARLESIAGEVKAMAKHISRKWIGQLVPIDDVLQEAFWAAAQAVRGFTDGSGNLGGYVYICIERHLWRIYRVERRYRDRCHQPFLLAGDDGRVDELEPLDYRAKPRSELAAWYDPEFVRLRRAMSMWTRVVLYLFCVERWQRQEIADLFRVKLCVIRNALDEARRTVAVCRED